MKIFGFKSALAMLTFSAMSLFLQAPSQAQVNKKLLSEVIKSCHRDMNTDYFKRIGMRLIDRDTIGARANCVNFRYKHLALIEQLPWLPYSGEVIDGYSASVVVTEILSRRSRDNSHSSNEQGDRLTLCLIDQDPKSSNCVSTLKSVFSVGGYENEQAGNYIGSIGLILAYICPKCVIASNDSSSFKIQKGFLNWFLSLDKAKRREIVSAFESSLDKDLEYQGRNAEQVYTDALKKIEQDDKEQRRRNLLGQ